jgi:predicted nucleic acid-binding protein
MPRIFVDSGVLIMAARGEPQLRDAALSWLEDPDHVLLTSPLVYLETVPKVMPQKL